MSSVKFSTNGVQVHQGPAYPFFNILRPPPFLPPVNDGNIPPTIIDPAFGAWVANEGTWIADTVYAVGSVIIDSNGNAEIVTAIAGTGTSGGAAPAWPTVPQKTAVDNAGANQITWTMLGRVGTAGATGGTSQSGNWAPSFAYLPDDQIRDANGNIQWCVVGGLSGAAAPTWATAQNGITTESSGVTWFNLGPTLPAGYTDGEFTFDLEGKVEMIPADQETLNIASILVSEAAGMGATCRQLDLQLVSFGVPQAQLTSGLVYGALPSGARSITSLTTGGLVPIPNYCHTVLSPRRSFSAPTRFYTGTLMKASAKGSKPGLGFGRTKASVWKGDWDGLAVSTLPLGARGASLIEQ